MEFFRKISHNGSGGKETGLKKEIVPPKRKKGPLIFYRVVVALIITLVLALAAGSLYAILRPEGSAPLFRIGASGGRERQRAGSGGPALADGEVAVFSGIGRLRIPVASTPPATMLLSISFPYPADDRAFTEELASRLGEFRSIATGYFSSLPPEKITSMDEDAAKAEILRRYNALLRLGRIETLYFGDLMIVR